MAGKNSTNLVNFFIFNPTIGKREGEEEENILFYYPVNIDLDTKIRHTGLCQAIIKFTETFSNKPCQSFHTQKHRQLFYEPEVDFWIILTVSVPCHEKTKDGQSYWEYHEDDVQNSVFEAVLRQAYKMFKLFNGSFTNILRLNGGDVAALRQRLEYFFLRYLLTLKLPQSDILDIFNGIHFLPLDKNSYLRIQCFINYLEATFKQIQYTTFLYNDQLVWSGLEQEDMRTMYKYLNTSLFPSYQEQELQAGHSSSNKSAMPQSGNSHFGKFITGPPNIKDESNMGKIPRVYINMATENEECLLLVYRALSATVCLFLDGSSPLTFELCRNIDSFLGPQLTALASDISEQYSKRATVSTADPQYKYIYFNHMNLAQKTTVHMDTKKLAAVNIPPETLKLLSDINADMAKSEEDGETIVKTLTDCWVVGKKSDQREFYVVINQKNANLIEINEEVKRLCSTHFNSIFFLD